MSAAPKQMRLDAWHVKLSQVHPCIETLFCFFSSDTQVIYNDLLPDLLKNLFDQCCVKVAKNRPTLSHVVKTLSVSRLDFIIKELTEERM